LKIYVAAVEALRKKERGDETQFTTKIGGGKKLVWVPVILHPSIIFGYLLEPCLEIKEKILNFHRILAIENLKKHMILTLFKIFNKAFWLYIYIAQGVFHFYFYFYFFQFL
jgi:hypothetical protein